jgi:hypothetical protein
MKTSEVSPSYHYEENEVGEASTGRQVDIGNSHVKSGSFRSMIQVYSSLRPQVL